MNEPSNASHFQPVAARFPEPTKDERIAELDAAIAEIAAEHEPEWINKNAWVCVLCAPTDSQWPCRTRTIAEEAKAHDE